MKTDIENEQTELNRGSDSVQRPTRHYLPCPFCGLDDAGTVDALGETPAVALHSYPGVFRVECEGCGCNGPMRNDHAKASEAWNTRPNAASEARRHE